MMEEYGKTFRVGMGFYFSVGIIPMVSINTFLKPLVDELVDFWDGLNLRFRQKSCLFHCAFLCVACDQPAACKVCVFLSHSANLGCLRCYKKFPGKVGNKNYSGFDKKKWKPHSAIKHRNHIEKVLNAKSCEEKKVLVAKYGCRYSELLRSPYFDPIRMTIIDPMHCLFLGITKHVMKHIWLGSRVLKAESLPAIEEALETVQFKFENKLVKFLN